MTVFFQQLTAFYELMAWLASPVVMPYLGALFAVVAAVTVAPRTWCSVRRAVARVLIVALVWLTLAWIYHAGAAAFGQREGTGAAAVETGSRVGGPQPAQHQPPRQPTPITPETLGDLPPDCLLRIGFVPLATDPALPRDFACFVQGRRAADSGAPPTVTVIEGSDMDDFVARLVGHLREVPLPEVDDPVIQIRQLPYPGEGVLRMIKQKLELVCQERAVDARIEAEAIE